MKYAVGNTGGSLEGEEEGSLNIKSKSLYQASPGPPTSSPYFPLCSLSPARTEHLSVA